MANLLLAYDADCGSCTRFRHAVEFLDIKNKVDFVSLVEADDSGLLDQIPKPDRHTSFHLILPGGEVLSGANAIPRLLEILPSGTSIARVLSAVPGGVWLTVQLYSSFSRAHDGSSCSYHSPSSRRAAMVGKRTYAHIGRTQHSAATYIFAGALGGLVGSFVMGLFVGLPDALCVALATSIEGLTPTSHYLAWIFHVMTGVVIGVLFGGVTGALQLGSRKVFARSMVAGLFTGLLVWSGFFLPLMLQFLPRLVTPRLLVGSFEAHIGLGIVLGVVLSLALTLIQRAARMSATDGSSYRDSPG